MMWNGPFGFADGWGWFWPFHFIIPLLFFAAIIAVVRMDLNDGLPALMCWRNDTHVVKSIAMNIYRRSKTSFADG